MNKVGLPSPFVHLRVHSEFSVVDGILRISDLIERSVAQGQPAVALTDLSNVFGLIKFYKAARAAGVKPIVGCDVWLTNDEDRDKPYRILLLVANKAGYLTLCELLTQAWLSNAHRGRAEMRREWLANVQGLIVLSGARAGDVGQALMAGNREAALAHARQWKRAFPDSYYLELQRTEAEADQSYTQAALSIASELGLPVVATHPVQFLDRSDFRAHEARVCISEGQILTNPRRPHNFTEDQYLLDSDEMTRRFADVPSALANSAAIAQRCNLMLELGQPQRASRSMTI